VAVRFKPIPPPPADVSPLEALRAVRAAVPVVPRSDDDCCGRIADRVAWVDGPDAARTWLVFLRALGLVDRTESGYARSRDDLDRDELARRFRERVVGVEPVLEVLRDRPRTTAATGTSNRSGEDGEPHDSAETRRDPEEHQPGWDDRPPGPGDRPLDPAERSSGPDDRPLAPDAIHGRVSDAIPTWERHRSDTGGDPWRTRIAALLEWAACFGLVVPVDGGYVSG